MKKILSLVLLYPLYIMPILPPRSMKQPIAVDVPQLIPTSYAETRQLAMTLIIQAIMYFKSNPDIDTRTLRERVLIPFSHAAALVNYQVDKLLETQYLIDLFDTAMIQLHQAVNYGEIDSKHYNKQIVALKNQALDQLDSVLLHLLTAVPHTEG